jgi:hypothetical protein
MSNKPPAAGLIADLTWAELYAVRIRENLKILTPAVKRISTGAELTEPAARLRQQLKSANRTAAELTNMILLETRRSNRDGSDPPKT